MKKFLIAIFMVLIVSSVGFVCADESVQKDGYAFIRDCGEFNPNDVDSSKTVNENPISQYSPIVINKNGKVDSYKGDLNRVSVNVSGLEEAGESHGEKWSHLVSSTGDKNLNDFFTMSEEFKNYTNELGKMGIGYNEKVSNTILKTWYPDIWKNVTDNNINTTKNGYHFFAYVIKQQKDGIHVDGVVISAFVFKVIELKNNYTGTDTNATINDILEELGEAPIDNDNDTVADNITDEIMKNVISPENDTALENDTSAGEIMKDVIDEEPKDDNVSDESEEVIDEPKDDVASDNSTADEVIDDEFIPLDDDYKNSTGNETDSVSPMKDNPQIAVSNTHSTGNPILLVLVIFGLLVGAYVKR